MVAEEVFAVKHFTGGYENLIQTSKYVYNTGHWWCTCELILEEAIFCLGH